jgi:hypothetical protein
MMLDFPSKYETNRKAKEAEEGIRNLRGRRYAGS